VCLDRVTSIRKWLGTCNPVDRRFLFCRVQEVRPYGEQCVQAPIQECAHVAWPEHKSVFAVVLACSLGELPRLRGSLSGGSILLAEIFNVRWLETQPHTDQSAGPIQRWQQISHIVEFVGTNP